MKKIRIYIIFVVFVLFAACEQVINLPNDESEFTFKFKADDWISPQYRTIQKGVPLIELNLKCCQCD